MKIGLFGGTFDPIHLGHVDMIEQLRASLSLDRVLFIPAYLPPHKDMHGRTAYEDRFAMTKLAVDGHAGFVVSDYESVRQTPSYTLCTVEHFKAVYPGDSLYTIMGVDSFNQIETWHQWQKLLTSANTVVIDRPGNTLRASEETRAVLSESPCQVIHAPLHTLPISSTMIRARLARGERVDVYLPEPVLTYIQAHHLYE